MHIETLDAVHRESKRLPPIQKVTNSLFYITLDKSHAEPRPRPAALNPLSTNPCSVSQCHTHGRYVCPSDSTMCDSYYYA